MLAVLVVNTTPLTECLVYEITIQNKGYVAVVYRSHSQSSSEFESFLSGLEDFFLLRFTPRNSAQPLLGMELQEKQVQSD